MDITDAKLVEQARNGHTEAFGQLYDRYAGLIRAICYDATGRLADAQDLAQEAFLRAHAKLDELRDPDRFAPWLIGVAKNICREFRRSKARDRHVLVGLELGDTVEADPDRQPDDIADLSTAMAKLTERERLALNTYYLQGQDVEQTKRILNVSRSALYRLLAKARKKLEKFLTGNAPPHDSQMP